MTVRETVRFALEHGIDTLMLNILTPAPGTRQFADMEAEGRIFERDWRLYDGQHVVFTPQQLAPADLQADVLRGYARFYSLRRAASATSSACASSTCATAPGASGSSGSGAGSPSTAPTWRASRDGRRAPRAHTKRRGRSRLRSRPADGPALRPRYRLVAKRVGAFECSLRQTERCPRRQPRTAGGTSPLRVRRFSFARVAQPCADR